MSTGTATAFRPGIAPRLGWSLVALVFVTGLLVGGLGAIAATSWRTQTQASMDTSGQAVEQATPRTELTRLLGNMEAAASRGDTRLFLEFRQDLAHLIVTAGMHRYLELRGVSVTGTENAH